jgi:Flp pilus assembly protein TadD
MEKAVDQLAASTAAGDTVLFYYSGHGMQINGENLLVPVDFTAGNERDAATQCLMLDRVQKALDGSHARLTVLIIDACRTNPFHYSRSWGKGLAPVDVALGSYVAFASSPGQTADDNSRERNGLFTKFLLSNMTQQPRVAQLFRTVRETVYEASGHRQTPWIEDQMIGDFELMPGAANPASPAVAAASLPLRSGPDELIESGKTLLNAGKCQESLELLDRAARIAPENPFAQNAAGMAYLCLHLNAQALERFGLAIELKPDFGGAYLNRGTTYLAAGRYNLAVEDFTWSIDQDPNNEVLFVRRGRAYFGLRNYAAALDDLNRAIELNNAEALAWYSRAQVYQRQARYSDALADLNKAIERKPGYPEAVTDRAAVTARLAQR